MALETREILQRLDGVGFLREIAPEAVGPDQSGEMRFRCPFHADANPSASFNVTSRLFKCWSCGEAGSAIDLLARVTEQPRALAAEYLARRLSVSPARAINPKIVEEWHAALRINAALLAKLEQTKGINVASVERWRLGWIEEEKRLAIPIRDERGFVVNVKKYDLLKIHDPTKKYLNVKGHGQLRLWPRERLSDLREVTLVEGELKVIALYQRGFEGSLTATGGAHGWKDEWNSAFAGKKVAICYDVDATGKSRAQSLAKRLAAHAAELQVVTLPLDVNQHPHGDVNDYFTRAQYSPEDFGNLLRGTPRWEASDDRPVSPGLRDDLVYEVALESASKAQYYLRRLKINVIVSAKDTAPYLAPKEAQVACPMDLDCCGTCPVYLETLKLNKAEPGNQPTWTLEPDDPALLKLIDVNDRQQQRALREAIGVPKACDVSTVILVDTFNVEEVRLVPELSGYGSTGGEQTVVRAFYVGHGIETNVTYEAHVRAVVHPENQRSSFLIYQATSNVDSISEFSLAPAEAEELRLFQPAEWTEVELDRKLGELYRDLELNVTRIYERRALHWAMDLVWHSPLYLTFAGEPVKGWLDALVIGDSGQGKSETAGRLLRHYGLGEKVDMKGASVAGLKGGLQDTQGRWFVTWGVIPLNDRKLVVLEEVKGAPEGVLQALTEMRSSGVAELTKIERRRAFARTRLLWLSNPRSDRPIDTYGFGALAVKELLGSLEDVRRFDYALVVSSHEVDAAKIGRASGETVEHRHLGELCKRLILWTWSRRPEQAIFEPAAEAACVDLSIEQSQRYSSALPLIEPADHRYKLARIAAALAARTFSTNDGVTLLVREVHVRRAARFLEEIYSSKFSGYAAFSAAQASEAELLKPEEVKALIFRTPFPTELVHGFVRTNELRSADLEDWAGVDRDTARALISILVRNNALRRGRAGYYKTGPFIELLKELRTNGSIPGYVKKSLEY